MSIVSWLVVGLVAGYLAGMFVKGDEGLGVIGHLLLGVVGALVGGFIANQVLGADYTAGINIATIVVATIGAVIAVVAYKMLLGRGGTGRRI